ncbi:unnamed protein product [Lactuca virosa]|uniref:Uncharacterized protein n=1 Tax=Lactuca virosa TaxID=75947 RepID=A0AAU9M9Z3_9ASTR|nr:unnamed protein product [Lactuca virosa]
MSLTHVTATAECHSYFLPVRIGRRRDCRVQLLPPLRSPFSFSFSRRHPRAPTVAFPIAALHQSTNVTLTASDVVNGRKNIYGQSQAVEDDVKLHAAIPGCTCSDCRTPPHEGCCAGVLLFSWTFCLA